MSSQKVIVHSAQSNTVINQLPSNRVWEVTGKVIVCRFPGSLKNKIDQVLPELQEIGAFL